MHDLPQSNFVNPAVPAKCKFVIGFPALASVHANYSNTALTFKEAFDKDPITDSLYLKPSKVISGLNKRELIASEFHLTWFNLGFYINDYYLTFAINEKVSTYNIFPKEIMELGWKGNSAFLGRQAGFDGLRVNANHYREFAFGLSKETNSGWRWGARAKLLFGMANVYTPKTNGYLYTDRNTFNLDTYLNSKVHASFPMDVTTDDEGYISDIEVKEDFSASNYLLNTKNMGLGLDFGFICDLNDRLTLSGSLIDLGYINWQDETNTFTSNGHFSYAGTGTDSDFNTMDDLSHLGDSLKNIFSPKPTTGPYTSPLVPQIYLGATADLTSFLNAGLLFRSEFFRSKYHPSVTISANTYGFKRLNVSLSNTIGNGTIFNPGAGMGVQLGIFQLHALCDNFAAFLDPLDTRNVNFRFGLSFVPGCNKKNMKKKAASNGIEALPCYYNYYPDQKTSKKNKRKYK